jgi:prepilin-type N-terminal cleavage/methylation domain-containing protein
MHSSSGFTLIELMIVIAIIAIIAAIAIPNLLESRISSNEAAAASSLKTGIFPAEVQFQAGTYVDAGSPSGAQKDGLGDYATNFPAMSGMTGTYSLGQTGSTANVLPSVSLSLLSQTWDFQQPNVNNYLFNLGSNFEVSFCAACFPGDSGGDVGRRCFAINAGGTVYATAPGTTNPSSKIGTSSTLSDVPFGPLYCSSANAAWSVYRR